MGSSSWQKTKWGEVATLEYGKGLKDYKNGKGNIPVFGTNGLIGFTDKSLCKFPTVIVGRKGAYRGIHYSDEPFFVIDTAFYLNPKTENLDTKFAYYQLLTQNINAMDSGSAIPSTSREDFYNLDLLLPPLKIQKQLAESLSSLDDKIELNRQMNETLEAMARAIFKSWFVDFDPVYAKMEGRDYLLPAKVMDLFPDELEESELGLIPKGWRVVELNDIVKRINLKKRYKKDEILNYGNIPVFEQGNKILMGFHNNEADLFANSDDPKFIFGDHTCIMKLIIEPFSLGPNVIPLQGKGIPSIWAYYSSLEKQSFEEYRRHWMEFQIKKTIMPDKKKIIIKFIESIKPIIEKVNLNQKQNLILEEVRETLMPKLINGEIGI